MSELDAYDYELPRELIAQHPPARRADARLLVVDRARDTLEDAHIRDLPEFLRAGDCLVLNDTRVVPARLLGRRTRTGGRWEGLYLAAEEHGIWRLLSKTRGRLEEGESITLEDRNSRPDVRLVALKRLERGEWLMMPEQPVAPLELLERVGRIPLPKYIRGGEMEPADQQRYQTVYAAHPGSAAAPTAGLHFTPALLEALGKRGVERVEVTLHVGLGTFRPIAVASLEEHKMHAEWGRLEEPAARRLRATREAGGRIVAVGTTSVRVLETAAREGELRAWEGETDLFIRPPFTFHATDALLTNFHLPRSTLLVLVRTFGGDSLIRRAYAHAIASEYRFYSYGDAMLIL